jgi:hypothetical protein
VRITSLEMAVSGVSLPLKSSWENLKNDPPNFRIYKNDPVLDGPATFFIFCRAYLELCIKSWIFIKDCIETYLELLGLLILMKIGQVITSHPIWP